MSVVSVVCCQVEVSVMGLSLIQSCPTECGVSECDCKATIMRRPWPTGDSYAFGGGGGSWICSACLGISVLQVYVCQISLILVI